jgi:hypothetical protein
LVRWIKEINFFFYARRAPTQDPVTGRKDVFIVTIAQAPRRECDKWKQSWNDVEKAQDRGWIGGLNLLRVFM